MILHFVIMHICNSPSELPLDLCISASLAYRDSESDINVGMVVLLALTKYGEVSHACTNMKATYLLCFFNE